MSWVRRHWFPLAAGLTCFAWAVAGWLTVFPNQDILADAIQVQSVLADPRLVWSFPGQKHAGPLEYPYSLAAEWLAPGNYYVLSAIRPLLAFFTGLFAALLYLRLFPKAPRWAFLAAVVVGPTIISGFLGPEANRVGVWWLQPNWDMAWLLVAAGAYVTVRGMEAGTGVAGARQAAALAAGGLLVALGFYAHPAISITIVPILVLMMVRVPARLWMALPFAAGGLVGLIPPGISFVVNSGVINTWDPSHGPLINVPLYVAALGLGGNPDYMLALLPYALGLAPASSVVPPVAQSIVMWVFLLAVVSIAAISLDHAIRRRERLSAAGALAVAWIAAMGAIVGFATLVDPVWIYSSGLALLYWITVGALPSAFTWRKSGTILAVAALAIAAASTVAHNGSWYASVGQRITDKKAQFDDLDATAQALVQSGVHVVYGSYYDAIPVGYASKGQLRTVTNTYNRFPLSAEELSRGEWVVAVDSTPADEWGATALVHLQENCTEREPIPSIDMALFECRAESLVSR